MPTASLYAARQDSDDRVQVIWRCRLLLSRSRGFTIAEVFAALLVMAVGIIGIAALYSDQVQTNPEAQVHREAAALAEQIAERIRETKEGQAGFATTIGVLSEQQPKPKLPQDVAAREAACWHDEVEASCRMAWARSRATRLTARRPT